MSKPIKLNLKTEFHPNREVQAWVVYNGENIDQHYHSSEGWLLSDWGFCGNPQGDSSYHPKKITEKLGTDNWTLEYSDLNGKTWILSTQSVDKK